jgi:tetratricopeptide (TPR) repeat protein
MPMMHVPHLLRAAIETGSIASSRASISIESSRQARAARRHGRRMRGAIAASLAGALLLAAGCAATDASARTKVNDLVAHGNYAEAVRVAKNEADKKPDDPAATELHRQASIAYLIDAGRKLTFHDRDVEALELFTEAHTLDPESEVAYSWFDKTRRKLAWSWLGRALELHANDDLPGAADAYQKALEFSPGDSGALSGLATAMAGLKFRDLRGRGYFQEGLRAMSEYWLAEARSRFAYAGKYEPNDPHPKQRREEVDTLMAQQRVAVAREFEKRRHFASARGEYRAALLFDPSNEEAQLGKARCAEEAHAADLLRDARMAMLKGKFDKAATLIDQGLARTHEQQDLFEGMQARVQQARLDKLYAEAVSLERDSLYEQAVEKYAAILKETDYFKDVLARKDTLEQYIKLSDDLYAKAEATDDKAEKVKYFEQIRLIWPEYKDVAQQLKTLSAP